MANERDFKMGKKPATERHVCSITGRRCRCGTDAGCVPSRGSESMDEISKKDLRHLRSAHLLIDGAKEHLDEVTEDYLRTRQYPGPEVREIRRKLETAQAMIEELG